MQRKTRRAFNQFTKGWGTYHLRENHDCEGMPSTLRRKPPLRGTRGWLLPGRIEVPLEWIRVAKIGLEPLM